MFKFLLTNSQRYFIRSTKIWKNVRLLGSWMEYIPLQVLQPSLVALPAAKISKATLEVPIKLYPRFMYYFYYCLFKLDLFVMYYWGTGLKLICWDFDSEFNYCLCCSIHCCRFSKLKLTNWDSIYCLHCGLLLMCLIICCYPLSFNF